jgi:hypothetical protein
MKKCLIINEIAQPTKISSFKTKMTIQIKEASTTVGLAPLYFLIKLSDVLSEEASPDS